jgi:hypothetical protein
MTLNNELARIARIKGRGVCDEIFGLFDCSVRNEREHLEVGVSEVRQDSDRLFLAGEVAGSFGDERARS